MSKKLFLAIFSSFILVAALTSPAFAAKPSGVGGGKPDKGDSTKDNTPIGYDISWPQCGKKLPKDHAFGIVGVNGGNAATENPCLRDQLAWAAKASGEIESQDKVQLYVNTANPGQVMDQMTSPWPSSHAAAIYNPFGDCTGENDKACSWEYGWARGVYATEYFESQAVEAGISPDSSTYKWWLDVETMNSWQSGSVDAYANNVAALEGWVDYFTYIGAETGLYSTAYQWGEIVGDAVEGDSNLNGLDNWRPSGASLANAKSNCSLAPLTEGGQMVLTQYISRRLDHNYSCI